MKKNIVTSQSFKKDFEIYCKTAEWYDLDAVVLSLGESPKNSHEIIKTEAYNRRLLLLSSHICAGSISSRKIMAKSQSQHHVCEVYVIKPLSFLELLRQLNESYPKELEERVMIYHQQEEDHKKLYGTEHQAHEGTYRKLQACQNDILAKEKPMHTKERLSFQKMFVGILVTCYGYDSEKHEKADLFSNLIKEIEDDVLRVTGETINKDTVRKHVKESLEAFPPYTEK